MLLTKKEKEEIRQIVREELKEALVRTITVERGARGPGEPEKVVKEEEWNVLDFLAFYLPRIEAALRGAQGDIDRMKNQIGEQNIKLEAIGKTLLAMEQGAKTIAMLCDEIKKRQMLPTRVEVEAEPIDVPEFDKVKEL